MGRPIKSSNFGNITVDEGLTLIADIGAGNEPCWIVRQKGTRKYIVSSVAGGATPTRTGTVVLQLAEPAAEGEAQLDVAAFGVAGSGDGEAELSITNLRSVTATVVAPGSGYVVTETLTVDNGTETEQAIYDVEDLSTVQGQTQVQITVFNGGTGYDVADVLTMSDGSTVTVDAESGGNVITEFTVTTASTIGIVGNNQVITTVSSVPAGNDDFTMTMATATQGVFDVAITATDGIYTIIAPAGDSTTSSIAGTGCTLTTAYGINALTIDNGGTEYTDAAVVTVTSGGTGAALSVTQTAGVIDVAVVDTTGTGFTDLLGNIEVEGAGAEHARTITQYGVKTFEGNTYSWDLLTNASTAGFANLQTDG